MAISKIMIDARETLLDLQRPAPRLVHIRVQGYINVKVAKRIIEFAMETIAIHKPFSIVAYHDWYEVEGYDTEARRILTEFGKATKNELTKSHVCLKSKLVAMGVNVANALLGNIVAYSDRKQFAEKLTSAVVFYRDLKNAKALQAR